MTSTACIECGDSLVMTLRGARHTHQTDCLERKLESRATAQRSEWSQPIARDTKICFIRVAEVKKRTGMKKSSIYLAISRGEFPTPVKIGERAVAWIESEIESWIAARINRRVIR